MSKWRNTLIRSTAYVTSAALAVVFGLVASDQDRGAHSIFSTAHADTVTGGGGGSSAGGTASTGATDAAGDSGSGAPGSDAPAAGVGPGDGPGDGPASSAGP